MKRVEEILSNLCTKGYQLSGSVFKVDYNGKLYTVGFWVRPQNWNSAKDEYELPGFIGKAKHESFDQAVELAFEMANSR